MCEFENYIALCAQPITDQISAYITATVNRCRHPVDVTFQVESSNHTHSWEHTFANTRETQYLPSFWPDASLEVHLMPHKNNASLQAVRILAALFVDDLIRPFLNSTVVISPEHCTDSGSLFTIALILLVAFMLLLVTTVVVFLSHRYCKRKKTKNNSYAEELLRNPDGIISSAHLQEGVGYYDNPIRSSTTLIHNSVYKDTVCPETPPQRNKFSFSSASGWFKTENNTPRYAGSRLKPYPRQAITTVDDAALDRY